MKPPAIPRLLACTLRCTAAFAGALLSASIACTPRGGTTGPEPTVIDDTGVPTAAVWPDEEYRDTKPTAGPIASVAPPKVQTFTTDSGLTVHFIPTELPYVAMTIRWRVGAIGDPKGKRSRASLCAALISEGSRAREKVAWTEALADRASSIRVGAGLEASSASLDTIAEEFEGAATLLGELLSQPGLRADDLQRLKLQAKASLEQQRATPAGIGGRLVDAFMLGAAHPYGRIETPEQVDAITVADCAKFAAGLGRKGATVWVVGRTDEAQLRRVLDTGMAAWKGTAARDAKPPVAAARNDAIFFVHVKDAAQSQIYVGHTAPLRTAADYEATNMAVAILGGGFTSRINMNLREDKGISYGARGTISYRRHAAYFAASTSVDTPHTGTALREIVKEIAAMRAAPPSAAELSREVDGALLSLPADFASPRQAASTLASLDSYDLPLDWHDGYQARLREVSLDAVAAAAAKHLRADGLTVLVVGDWSVVGNDVQALTKVPGFPRTVQVIDADGRPAPTPRTGDDTPSASAKSGAK